MKTHTKYNVRGFSLIETMVGLLIMSFGILALVGMQTTLSRNGDVAKQRTEAIRLAQERLETMRSYTHIDPVTTATSTAAATPVDPHVSGTLLAWSSLADGVDNPSSTGFSNAEYTRTWTVGGTAADLLRPVSVLVSWTDRAGQNQSVTLNSVIARVDPTSVGALGFPLPNNTNLKQPKNRSMNIPVPAIDVGSGKSAYNLGNNLSVIFSNTSGYVVQQCSGTVDYTTYNNNTAGCTTLDAFIIAGYVSGSITNSGTTPSEPTGINTDLIVNNGAGDISCSYTVAKDQSTGNYIASHHYYLCVIPVTPEGGKWSGTVRLGGLTSGKKVCRYEYSNASTFDNNNQRNVQPYSNVSESLDNQNYYVTTGNCPSGTVLHQTCNSGECPSNVSSVTTTTSTSTTSTSSTTTTAGSTTTTAGGTTTVVATTTTTTLADTTKPIITPTYSCGTSAAPTPMARSNNFSFTWTLSDNRDNTNTSSYATQIGVSGGGGATVGTESFSVSTGQWTLPVNAPSGNNKTFTVTVTVTDYSGNGESKTCYFQTTS